jgi:predicted LPLAT superfamily acyltransferase
MNTTTHWSKLAEVGSSWGLNLTFGLYRLLGERLIRLLLHAIVFWFYLFVPRARRASDLYLTKLHAVGGFAHRPGWRDHYHHIYAFASAALDKVAAWMGRISIDRVVFDNQAELYTLRDSGRGAVIVGSHLGSLETARALATKLGQQRKINAIVYTDHAIRFNAVLARANPGFAVNLIQVSQLGPDTAIELSEKIERGELLFIVGDRTPPAENGRVLPAEFLGAPAPFAQGPWILASLLKCPVYLFFCVTEGPIGRHRFRVHFEAFTDSVQLPRKSREAALRELIQRYATRLEHYCRQAPLQWFNFYDFWHS